MYYGDVGSMGGQKQGLGVQTGLTGLDRVLNRDNSYLSESHLIKIKIGDSKQD